MGKLDERLGFHRWSVTVLAEDNGMVGRGIPQCHPRIAGQTGSYPGSENGECHAYQRDPKIVKARSSPHPRVRVRAIPLSARLFSACHPETPDIANRDFTIQAVAALSRGGEIIYFTLA
jgi:hypothetical protein